MNYVNGNEVIAEFKLDLLHGKGALKYANGQTFEGIWIMGKREGKGRLINIDWKYIEGEWKNDEAYGCGIYYDPDSNNVRNLIWEDGKCMLLD